MRLLVSSGHPGITKELARTDDGRRTLRQAMLCAVDCGHGFWDACWAGHGGGATGVAETTLVSMGGCITSALTLTSAVEVVGAVLGAVSTGAGRGVGALAAG
jgi:hypothetical protein